MASMGFRSKGNLHHAVIPCPQRHSRTLIFHDGKRLRILANEIDRHNPEGPKANIRKADKLRLSALVLTDDLKDQCVGGVVQEWSRAVPLGRKEFQVSGFKFQER